MDLLFVGAIKHPIHPFIWSLLVVTLGCKQYQCRKGIARKRTGIIAMYNRLKYVYLRTNYVNVSRSVYPNISQRPLNLLNVIIFRTRCQKQQDIILYLHAPADKRKHNIHVQQINVPHLPPSFSQNMSAYCCVTCNEKVNCFARTDIMESFCHIQSPILEQEKETKSHANN